MFKVLKSCGLIFILLLREKGRDCGQNTGTRNFFERLHSWVKGIQVCSNKGPCPFPRGDNDEIAKIHWRNLKILFSRTTGPISTKLCTKHPWMKEIQVCSNEEPFNSHKDNNVFILLFINVMIYWFALFSQVSDVSHGPLVYNIYLLFIEPHGGN